MTISLFSSREIALFILILIFLIFILRNNAARKSILKVIEVALSRKLVVPFIGALIYCSIITFSLTKLDVWKWKYLKEISMWFLFIGVPSCYKALNIKPDDHYFKNFITNNMKIIVLIEFIFNSLTFHLIIEIILQGLIIVISLLKTNEKSNLLNKLLDKTLIILGFIIIVMTIVQLIKYYHDLDLNSLFIGFLIPIIFSIAYLPIVYIFALFSLYEHIFLKIDIVLKNTNQLKIRNSKIKLTIIGLCNVSFKHLYKFDSFVTKNGFIGVSKKNLKSLTQTFKKFKYEIMNDDKI